MDGLVSQLLRTERMVTGTQILSYYYKVLQDIQETKELDRMQDFLTPNQVEVLLTVLPRKEDNY